MGHDAFQVRLAALDKLRLKVDTQRYKLEKLGQEFVRKQQERKTHRTSARNSFEKDSPSSAGQPRPSQFASSSTTGLAAAAAAALSQSAAAGSDDDVAGSSSSGSFAVRRGADAGLLNTPPSSPMPSFSAFAAAAAAPTTAGMQASPAATNASATGAASGSGTQAAASNARHAPEDSSTTTTQDTPQEMSAEADGVDSDVEGLVRLRSFPLMDAPTSIASSGNSRTNSAEQLAAAGGGTASPTAAGPASGSAHDAAAAAKSPRAVSPKTPAQPTVHGAMPVPPMSSGYQPLAGGAPVAAALTTPAHSPQVTPPHSPPEDQDQQGKSAVEAAPAGSSGLDEADEESWAAAVVHKRGTQGLLQAHEMVERGLGRESSQLACSWAGKAVCAR